MFIRKSPESNPYIEFITKRIKKWKQLKEMEKPYIPSLLCRMCEQVIPANKMQVYLYVAYNYLDAH